MSFFSLKVKKDTMISENTIKSHVKNKKFMLKVKKTMILKIYRKATCYFLFMLKVKKAPFNLSKLISKFKNNMILGVYNFIFK